PVRPARPVALPIGKELKPKPTIPPQVMEAPRGSASEEPGKPLPGVTISKHDAAKPFPSSPSVAARTETDNIQSARPSDNTTALSAYMKVCRQLIEKHKEYPIMARKGRREGTVLIHVVLKRDGSLDQSGVGKSSGYSILDNAALRSVKSVGSFPSLPPELQGNELTFDVQISFKLSND
ncbi:MAG TPA: TonB family protein, partial [Geobacteraceae bacterium]|nr:TonB family protein [Geobacteraceae bacterium]